MKKIIVFCFFICWCIFYTYPVFASDLGEARIGNNFYNNLEEAIKAASSQDTISLNANVNVENSLEINKTVNINLNGHSITANEKVFAIQGGSLNLTGSGKVIEKKPNYGAIFVTGSNDATKKDYSTVSVGPDVFLEGWSGIFINHLNKTGYGIRINMNGSINSIPDANGTTGAGIYVNGNIQNQNNAPIINLSDTVKISSAGNGIYAAGYANYNINGAYISGKEAGLGIKAGVFNILNGTIVGSGENKIPASGNNNGINPSGAAIQIESNPNYSGNIELNIKNGFINSKQSNVIYEYTINNTPTKVNSLNISGGKFESDNNNNVFNLSESLENKTKFISGGSFSSNPTEFVKAGFKVIKNEDSLYEVIKNSISVFAEGANKTGKISTFIIIFFIVITGTLALFNKNKLISIFIKK